MRPLAKVLEERVGRNQRTVDSSAADGELHTHIVRAQHEAGEESWAEAGAALHRRSNSLRTARRCHSSRDRSGRRAHRTDSLSNSAHRVRIAVNRHAMRGSCLGPLRDTSDQDTRLRISSRSHIAGTQETTPRILDATSCALTRELSGSFNREAIVLSA